MLQIGEGDTGHQRVPVKTCPGAALEVAQPQFLVELLVAVTKSKPSRSCSQEDECQYVKHVAVSGQCAFARDHCLSGRS